MRIRHKGLRALHERDDAVRLPAGLAPRFRRILFRLQEAAHPGSADASRGTGAWCYASTTVWPWT